MRIRATSLLVALSFVAIALLITWPLATCADRCLSGNLGDPLLNAWIVGWGAERLADGFAGVWDAPIFHPYEDTLAYSEHLLGIAALVAPVYWLSGNAVLAYNVAFITAYALAAFGMYLLAKRLVRADVAFVIALAFASSPYLTTSQSTRLQMLFCGWMAIGLAGLHDYFDTRSRARLAVFVIAYLMLGLSNIYLFVFFAIPSLLVMTYGVWLSRPRLRTVMELTVAVTIVAAAIWPIAGLYRDVQRDLTLERTVDENVLYSAAIRSYASVWHESPLARWLPPETVADRALFPGLTLVGLASLNVPRLIGRLRRRPESPRATPGPRTWVGAYALTVVVAFLLSLGPVPHIGAEPFADAGPYAWVMRAIPGVDGLRAPARFGAIVLLGLGILAAIGLSASLAGRSRGVRRIAIAAVCAAAVAEGAVAPPRLVNFPTVTPADRQAFDWLDGEPPGAVLVLPIVPDHFRRPPSGGVTQTLVYQYATLLHGRPIVNGSSGFKPPLVELLEGEASPFLDPEHVGDALQLAQALEVRYLMVHERDFRDQAYLRRLVAGLRSEADHVLGERVFGAIRLFELRPPEVPFVDRQPDTQAVASSRFQVFASDQAHRVEHVLDRDPDSRWQSGPSQVGTEWLSLHFDAPVDVSHLRLTLDGAALGDYPRRLQIVSLSADGDSRTLFDGSPIVPLALALVRRPVDRAIDLAFDENDTEQLLMRQVGRSASHPWSVHELEVWER